MPKPRIITDIVKRMREISSKIASHPLTELERRQLASELRDLAKQVDTLDARKITEEERDPSKKGIRLNK